MKDREAQKSYSIFRVAGPVQSPHQNFLEIKPFPQLTTLWAWGIGSSWCVLVPNGCADASKGGSDEDER